MIEIRPLWSSQDFSGQLPEKLQQELSTTRQIPVLLACQNNEIIGCAYTLDRSCQLLELFIEKSFRRQGIGSRLLICLSKLLLGYGCTKLQLETKQLVNANSRAFLHSMGDDKFVYGKSQSTFRLHSWISPQQLELQNIHKELGIPADYGISRALCLQFDAQDLTGIGEDCWQRPQQMSTEAAAAWSLMRHHAELENIQLLPVSAYRSTNYQTELIRRKLNQGQSIDQILAVSAAPGFSEHHSGKAIDITTDIATALQETFAETTAYRWLNYNAGDYGFSLSYPQDNPHGISWEPWHWYWRPE